MIYCFFKFVLFQNYISVIINISSVLSKVKYSIFLNFTFIQQYYIEIITVIKYQHELG